jgi:trehalose synthase
MWKARPVVASRIGGIQDQIVDGVNGVLLDDPLDLRAYGDAVLALLRDPEGARSLGHEAQNRVRDDFLAVRSLVQYVDLIARLVA